MNFYFSSYFFQIQSEDRKIIQALCTAFQNNGRMYSLIGKGNLDFSKKLKTVISYCYFMVKKLGGIFISKDKQAFLLFYQKSKYYFSW